MIGLAGLGVSQRSARWDDSGAYAEPELCATCHQSIWNSYRLTGMGRSFYRARPGTRLEGLPLEALFDHQASASRFTMLERDGRHYQRWQRIGSDGMPANAVEKEVDYVIGSGNHARTFLHRTDRNTLIELPLAWYSEQGGYWAMNPGFDQPDHWGFRREITYDCMFCHNSYPSGTVVDAARTETVFPESLPEGIDCQRCHGPGRRHAELAVVPGAALKDVRDAIVNPARLSPERQLEVCMQCHLETTSAPLPNSLRRYDRAPFSYIPGQPLEEFRLYFDHEPGSGHDDKFEIVGAAYRLRQSACFRESNGALLCTTCHDPHVAAPDSFDAVCGTCHRSELSRLVPSGDHPASAACADCHMPKRRTDDVVHVVMTDHLIQRPGPEQGLTSPRPERSTTEASGYRGAVVPYYPQPWPQTPEGEIYLAVAQTRDGSNRAQGIAQLETAIARHRPTAAQFYLELADAFSATGETEKALPYYRGAAQRQPSELNLRKLAAALRSLNQFQEAAAIVMKGLAAAPKDYASWHELGLIRTAQDRDSDAISAYERALIFNPELPETHNNLGAIWMHRREHRRAESSFRSAVRVDPNYADAHANLGNLLAAAGDFHQAEGQFKIALRLRPNDGAARYNYAVALTRAERLEEAKEQLLLAVASDRDRAEAHVLLGDLLRAEGQAAPALEHYREALRSQPDLARAHLSLGVALVNSGETDEGLVHIRRAVQSSDGSAREEAVNVLRQLGVPR